MTRSPGLRTLPTVSDALRGRRGRAACTRRPGVGTVTMKMRQGAGHRGRRCGGELAGGGEVLGAGLAGAVATGCELGDAGLVDVETDHRAMFGRTPRRAADRRQPRPMMAMGVSGFVRWARCWAMWVRGSGFGVRADARGLSVPAVPGKGDLQSLLESMGGCVSQARGGLGDVGQAVADVAGAEVAVDGLAFRSCG